MTDRSRTVVARFMLSPLSVTVRRGKVYVEPSPFAPKGYGASRGAPTQHDSCL